MQTQTLQPGTKVEIACNFGHTRRGVISSINPNGTLNIGQMEDGLTALRCVGPASVSIPF